MATRVVHKRQAATASAAVVVPTTPPAAGPFVSEGAGYTVATFAAINSNYSPSARLPVVSTTTAPTTSTGSTSAAKAGLVLTQGALIGIIVGGVVVGALVIGGIVWWCVRKRKSKRASWNPLNDSVGARGGASHASEHKGAAQTWDEPRRDLALASHKEEYAAAQYSYNSPASVYGGGTGKDWTPSRVALVQNRDGYGEDKPSPAATRAELFDLERSRYTDSNTHHTSAPAARPESEQNNGIISFSSPHSSSLDPFANYPPPPTPTKYTATPNTSMRQPSLTSYQPYGGRKRESARADAAGDAAFATPSLRRHPTLPSPPSALAVPAKAATMDERFQNVMSRSSKKLSTSAIKSLKEQSLSKYSRETGNTDTVGDFADIYGRDSGLPLPVKDASSQSPRTPPSRRNPPPVLPSAAAHEYILPDKSNTYTSPAMSSSSSSSPYPPVYKTVDNSPTVPQDSSESGHRHDLHRVDSRPLNDLEEILESFARGPNGESVRSGSQSSKRSAAAVSPTSHRTWARPHQTPHVASATSNRHVRGDSLSYQHQYAADPLARNNQVSPPATARHTVTQSGRAASPSTLHQYDYSQYGQDQEEDAPAYPEHGGSRMDSIYELY